MRCAASSLTVYENRQVVLCGVQPQAYSCTKTDKLYCAVCSLKLNLVPQSSSCIVRCAASSLIVYDNRQVVLCGVQPQS